MKGLAHGRAADAVVRTIGSVAATYALEHLGGTSHAYTWDEFVGRYEQHFGPLECSGRQSPVTVDGPSTSVAVATRAAELSCRRLPIYDVPAATRARAAATIGAYLACISSHSVCSSAHLRVVELGRRDDAVLVRHLRRWSTLSRASSSAFCCVVTTSSAACSVGPRRSRARAAPASRRRVQAVLGLAHLRLRDAAPRRRCRARRTAARAARRRTCSSGCPS